MENYDLKAYKKSKVYCEHLAQIIKVLNLTEKGLSHFQIYLPVQKILEVIKNEKRVLEIHYEKNKKIKETKGKV